MTAAQRRASAPEASVWVDASAGTGKTKVLTDRVLRLLLGGTAPERILCLTFTRAAAAEMALRMASALARWTVADAEALAAELETLTGSAPGAPAVDRARRLFAAVLDVPGGMKIQTIHAFCQSLLRRFPLEAGVAPHFRIADERTSAELLGAARTRVLDAARGGPGDPLADALAQMTALVGETGFADLLAAVDDRRARFGALVARHGGTAGLVSALRSRLGLAEGVTADGLLAEGSADSAFDGKALVHAVEVLAEGSETDGRRARRIEAWLDADPADRAAGVEDYRRAFFRQDEAPIARLVTKKLDEAHPELWPTLADEQHRLAALFDRWNAARVAESTGALIEVAARHLAFYREEKARHAVLDYDDLIESGGGLLTRPGLAPWVLYKLDGGLDHLLIDEAQDTSPAQWAMIAAFADEFFAGEGARETARTLFAVGDEKQSIFSFQGADVRAFVGARHRFRRQAEAAERPWKSLPLADSFRSTGAVLAVIDAVFARPAARDGVASEDAPIRHGVTRAGAGGRVELWPPVALEEAEEPAPWTPPVAREAVDDPAARLAVLVAERIAGWMEGPATVANGAWLEARGRRVRPGDVLVLVRRRTGFVDHLMRALKARDVPVAGIDRMVLTEQIAVMDLLALGAFCLLPGDDLTLATVLKSPLIGLDEDALFALAHGRDGERLWAVLARRRGERPVFERAYRALRAFLAAADSLPPFEFYSEALAARGGRAALLGRLGPESGDAIDEFLALALSYGRTHPPSLQGFLHWLRSGRAEITRDFEQERDEVRIMTVHGAKGLEAPVVFLPDTMRKPRGSDPLVWLEEEGEGGGRETVGLLWPGRAAREDPVSRAARARARAEADAEHRRLLYVAMTRAEDRLYVCGWRGRQKAPADCWYELVQAGMRTLDRTEPLPMSDGGEGLVYAAPQTAALKAPPPPPAQDAVPPLPPELLAPAPDEPAPPRPLAPSRAASQPALRSPIDAAGRSALARGTHVHRLLERLPSLAPADRAAAARRLLAASDLEEGAREALADSVLALLSAPEYAALFGPEALAEAPVSAVVGGRAISGRIDRLLVGEREVIALDYKSGRAAPETAAAVPRAWREQMAGYRAALAAVFPTRRIACGLLFVDDPRLIWLPDDTPPSG